MREINIFSKNNIASDMEKEMIILLYMRRWSKKFGSNNAYRIDRWMIMW